jgi:hypothetical protein
MVALYTAALPHVIFVFRAIGRHISAEIAAKVPLFLLILLSLVYVILCVKKKRTVLCIAILAIAAVIVVLIMTFEANLNKHIHIPEYVLMTWILFWALSLDYMGSGSLLLIFICATMLGVVDELMQGIHSERTYGWIDMIIDAASSFIGVLTLMGLKEPSKGDWSWVRHLKNFKCALGVIVSGAVTAVLICIFLFKVQHQETFWNVYPRWLLGCSTLFLTSAVAVIAVHGRHSYKHREFSPEGNPLATRSRTTALLWMLCPLSILIILHSAVMWVAIAGINFR